ncbi:transporter substrate-binding domain-containing protein [Streptomyces sp. NPDC052069]|uniref:transporter substrate-binding domain-containing protein n=1 Tax=Streptomyces sp. NPDC052069 TaxID=3154650 RepID=UPI00341E29CD
MQQLEDLFPYPRAQWSEFLKGHKLITLWLLENVVTKLVPPQDQHRQRGIGRQLLKAAEQADAARRAAGSAADPPEGTVSELQLRLDDARQGQIKAQATVQGLTQLIYAFVSAMADLKQRCRNLETERDTARRQLRQQEASTTANQQSAAENRRRAAENQQRLAETEERLAEAEKQCARVEERLARARREQQEAEDLRIEALQQAEQHRRAYQQRTGKDTPAGSPGGDGDSVPPPQPWEYDRFLEAADAQLDSYDAHMDAIREQIGIPAPPASDEPRTIPGEAAPTPSQDSTGTGTGTANITPGPSAVSEDNSADGADNSGRNRGDDPPANRSGSAGGRRDRGWRTVLISTTCLALLAGGWLAWDQLRDEGVKVPPDTHGPQRETDEASLPESGVLQKAKNNEKIRIGVKADQPGLSEKSGNKWSGFDIEFARNIAKALGFGDRIEFIAAGSRSREDMLQNGQVDIFVGSYSITPGRKTKVAFAGPYLSTNQGVLAVEDPSDTDKSRMVEGGEMVTKEVNSLEEFPNGTRICTASESISKEILDKFPEKDFTVDDSKTDYKACVEELKEYRDASAASWKTHVVVTDRIILSGFLTRNPDLKVIRDYLKGSTTRWGVGMAKNDPALHRLVCKSIAEQIEDKTWDELRESHLQEGIDKAMPTDIYVTAPQEKQRIECRDK